MIEILPERARANLLLQIAMRRHHHADVHAHRTVAAHALDLALFEHAQKLGLHHRRHVADFVQKQSAAICLLELAGMARGRARERALLVAE